MTTVIKMIMQRICFDSSKQERSSVLKQNTITLLRLQRALFTVYGRASPTGDVQKLCDVEGEGASRHGTINQMMTGLREMQGKACDVGKAEVPISTRTALGSLVATKPCERTTHSIDKLVSECVRMAAMHGQVRRAPSEEWCAAPRFLR